MHVQYRRRQSSQHVSCYIVNTITYGFIKLDLTISLKPDTAVYLTGNDAKAGKAVAGIMHMVKSRGAGDGGRYQMVNRNIRIDDYVRRVDLDGNVNQLRDGMKELKDESREGARETNKRLDQVLAALAQDKK